MHFHTFFLSPFTITLYFSLEFMEGESKGERGPQVSQRTALIV